MNSMEMRTESTEIGTISQPLISYNQTMVGVNSCVSKCLTTASGMTEHVIHTKYSLSAMMVSKGGGILVINSHSLSLNLSFFITRLLSYLLHRERQCYQQIRPGDYPQNMDRGPGPLQTVLHRPGQHQE